MENQEEDDRIRRLAYKLWERQGSPDGPAEDLWEQAKISIAVGNSNSAKSLTVATGNRLAPCQ